MATTTLKMLKDRLVKDGFEQKAVVSKKQMAQLVEAFEAEKGVVSTPPEELRYIEGLAELPFGYLAEFKVLPAKGYEKCACGRTPTALEIVQFALKKKVHDKSLIRDTLIGFENIMEIAQSGRPGECISCGRPVVMAGYFKQGYMYA